MADRVKIPSFKKFDYRLRPAKSIERKMLAEAFRKLSLFDDVKNYRYVGMGSLYFSDFTLFHRQLGFKSMISIEKEEDAESEARFKFNCPFNCIKLIFGHTQEVLSTLPWNIRSVVWLDYDGKLDSKVLSDISFLSSKILSGSLLLVSVNAVPDAYRLPIGGGKKSMRLQGLRELVGRGKVSPTLREVDVFNWGMANICRDIIQNEIDETLNRRNGVLEEDRKVRYRQIFNFHYEDGAKMLTAGGIFFEEKDKDLVSKCAFNSLDFYRPATESYDIYAPLLTFREIRALDGELPLTGKSKIPVPEEDINKYEKVYRYFPNFTEAEI
jgi:hypothetical protein